MPLRVSAHRVASAPIANVFAIESFMDDLAAMTPAQTRWNTGCAFMEDERARDVLHEVRPKHVRLGQPGRAAAIMRPRHRLFAQYKNLQACYCAVAARGPGHDAQRPRPPRDPGDGCRQ